MLTGLLEYHGPQINVKYVSEGKNGSEDSGSLVTYQPAEESVEAKVFDKLTQSSPQSDPPSEMRGQGLPFDDKG
ncbi:hypothetical protein LIER_25660 [Lithospermum erythrorhizon]|uniref:Uncharacterized protein n=1 Tax=Lithospermum erythrorhizon TaxID=34254 RepID=A0AAV3R739_LITER